MKPSDEQIITDLMKTARVQKLPLEAKKKHEGVDLLKKKNTKSCSTTFHSFNLKSIVQSFGQLVVYQLDSN